MNRLGLTHLSFRVGDVEAVAATIESLGGSVVRAHPDHLRPRRARRLDFLYCTDPDGVRIELMDLPGDRPVAAGRPGRGTVRCVSGRPRTHRGCDPRRGRPPGRRPVPSSSTSARTTSGTPGTPRPPSTSRWARSPAARPSCPPGGRRLHVPGRGPVASGGRLLWPGRGSTCATWPAGCRRGQAAGRPWWSTPAAPAGSSEPPRRPDPVTVYLDDWRQPARLGPVDDRWSHLVADTDDELHAFAARMGMRRAWFQDKAGRPHQAHYDVPERARRRGPGQRGGGGDLAAAGPDDAGSTARGPPDRHRATARSGREPPGVRPPRPRALPGPGRRGHGLGATRRPPSSWPRAAGRRWPTPATGPCWPPSTGWRCPRGAGPTPTRLGWWPIAVGAPGATHPPRGAGHPPADPDQRRAGRHPGRLLRGGGGGGRRGQAVGPRPGPAGAAGDRPARREPRRRAAGAGAAARARGGGHTGCGTRSSSTP